MKIQGTIQKEFYSNFGKDYKKEFDELLEFQNEFKKHSLNINIDLDVIRSHEYYTGLYFEINVINDDKKFIEIGRGGRFDRLVQCFISNEKKKIIPCSGFTFRTERLLEMVNNLKLIKKSSIINRNYIFQEELNYSIPENDTIKAYMKFYNSLEEKKNN